MPWDPPPKLCPPIGQVSDSRLFFDARKLDRWPRQEVMRKISEKLDTIFETSRRIRSYGPQRLATRFPYCGGRDMNDLATNGSRASWPLKLQMVKNLAGLVLLILLTGCAARSLSDPAPYASSINSRCPSGYLMQCDIWGGNKFKKRYGTCGCIRRGDWQLE